MELQHGNIIKSTQALVNTNFENATIILTEYNNKGAVGFIINKLFTRKLNDLEENKHLPAFPLYEGGPVDNEHLYFIHRRPDLIKGSIQFAKELFFGGDFKQVIQCIERKEITTNDIKIFIGYCGWDGGEVEEEVREGSWTIVEDHDDLFVAR